MPHLLQAGTIANRRQMRATKARNALNRTLLPEHDLNVPTDLLTANATQTIQAIACGKLIAFYRDGRRLFEYNDPHPYTSGWFAFRTTQNHMEIRGFQVWELTMK